MNTAELYRYCPGQGLSLVLTSTTSIKLKPTFGSEKVNLIIDSPSGSQNPGGKPVLPG